jgi:hypothetical protein
MGSFRIQPIGSTGLKIVDPPVYWIVAFLVVVAIVAWLAFSGSIMARFSNPRRVVSFGGESRPVSELRRGWAMPAISCVIALAASYFLWCSLQTSTLVLDRQSGTYSVDGGRAFFVAARASGPLSDIAGAKLETDTGAQRFVIVLQDGRRISLGSFADQGNQSEAVAAVNHFLNIGGTND